MPARSLTSPQTSPSTKTNLHRVDGLEQVLAVIDLVDEVASIEQWKAPLGCRCHTLLVRSGGAVAGRVTGVRRGAGALGKQVAQVGDGGGGPGEASERVSDQASAEAEVGEGERTPRRHRR